MEMEKSLTGGRTEVFRLRADNSRGTLKHVDVVRYKNEKISEKMIDFQHVPCRYEE